MKVVISNFSSPVDRTMDFKYYWAGHTKPKKEKRLSLFEYRVDWGFHIYSIGVYLMDMGIADEVEFWDYSEKRSSSYHPFGVLRVMFYNEKDVMTYLDRYGYPDLYINHGRYGLPILEYLEGKCFRVHVPALRTGLDRQDNFGAECFDDIFPGVVSRFDDFSGQCVGVDDRRAQMLEDSCDGALARRDTAGQTD